jgi:hypothetical protein
MKLVAIGLRRRRLLAPPASSGSGNLRFTNHTTTQPISS